MWWQLDKAPVNINPTEVNKQSISTSEAIKKWKDTQKKIKNIQEQEQKELESLKKDREENNSNENVDLDFMFNFPIWWAEMFLNNPDLLKQFQQINEYMNNNDIKIENIKIKDWNTKIYELTWWVEIDNKVNSKELLNKLTKAFNLKEQRNVPETKFDIDNI